MDLQNEKCVMVIDENLPLGIIEIVNKKQGRRYVFTSYAAVGSFLIRIKKLINSITCSIIFLISM